MKLLIDNLNKFYAENVRLVKTLMKRESPDEYPEELKWALQMLYFDGRRWIEICRIDNYPHDKMVESHIHAFKGEHVKRVQMTFQDAEKAIKEISERILAQEFREEVKFE